MLGYRKAQNMQKQSSNAQIRAKSKSKEREHKSESQTLDSKMFKLALDIQKLNNSNDSKSNDKFMDFINKAKATQQFEKKLFWDKYNGSLKSKTSDTENLDPNNHEFGYHYARTEDNQFTKLIPEDYVKGTTLNLNMFKDDYRGALAKLNRRDSANFHESSDYDDSGTEYLAESMAMRDFDESKNEHYNNSSKIINIVKRKNRSLHPRKEKSLDLSRSINNAQVLRRSKNRRVFNQARTKSNNRKSNGRFSNKSFSESKSSSKSSMKPSKKSQKVNQSSKFLQNLSYLL